MNYYNYLIILITNICFMYGYCATLGVDINTLTNPPSGNWIVLANGSWNDWGWGVQLTDEDADGIYIGTLCDLSDGDYQYVYSITGDFDSWSGWGEVGNAPLGSYCDYNPNDEWLNYGFNINGSDAFSEFNSWGECGISDPPIQSDYLIRPYNGDIINYTYVPFEWMQSPDAIGYNLNVSSSSDFNQLIIDIYIEDLLYLAKSYFDWGESYFWRIQPVYVDGLGDWTELNSFTIGEREFDLNGNIFSENLSDSEYTIFGDWNNYRSSIVDLNGNEVWNSGDFGFMMHHVSEYGQLFGNSMIDFPNNTGIEISYDEEIVWSANRYIDQHEFKQISNGNYMGFTSSGNFGPIPDGSWAQNFINMGFQVDGVTEEYPFSAQKINEFDKETGEVVWSWDPHDYFNRQETDLYGGTWWNSLTWGSHDWLHANAFFFDEDEGAIYVSYRHISRITKIAYPSGEVVWNMGLPPGFGVGDDNICSDLEFSFQHHVTILDNGDLLFFDNGNLDQNVFNQEVPTSRAFRVNVVDDSYCEVVWSFELPPYQFGAGMGSVQLLDNGNYFINSTGDGGTVLEVSPEGEVLWYMNLGMSWPNGSGYRAFRIPSVHADLYSVSAKNYTHVNTADSSMHAIEISNLNNEIEFKIINHTGYAQQYQYEVSNILGDVVDDVEGVIEIEPYGTYNISFNSNDQEIDFSTINLTIFPFYHSYAQKSIDYNIVSVFEDIILGDVNFDSSLDVIDIVLLVSFIIGGSEFNQDQIITSDLNEDNSIDVLDIVSLINIILNQ